MKLPFRFYLSHFSTGSYEIKYGPDMSDELSLVFARNLNYHGIQRTVGVNVKFVKDGYDYLQAVYEAYGIAADITFTILELNKQINDYQLFFEGKINLESYNIDKIIVTVGIEETGILQKFTNNDDIEVNLQNLTSLGDVAIPPFENETIDLSLHSKTISKRFYGHSDKDMDEHATPEPWSTRIGGGAGFADYYHIRYMTFSFLDEIDEIEGFDGTGLIITGIPPAPILVVEEPGNHKFKMNLNYTLTTAGRVVSAVPVYNQGCPIYTNGGGCFDWIKYKVLFIITNPTDPTRNETIILREDERTKCGLTRYEAKDAFYYEIERDLIVGDEVQLYGQMESSSTLSKTGLLGVLYDFYINWYGINHIQNSLDVQALTKSPVPNSNAEALLNFEIATRILQSITDLPDPFRSTLFGRTDSYFPYPEDGDGSLLAISNGFQIRQFPLEEKPIFASFKDWFQSMDAIYNIGVGIENNKVVCERKSYFYSPVVIWSFDNVEYSKNVAREYYFNEFENGFAKWENDEVNGLDEFNSKREWTLPMPVIKSKLSKLSPYIGSGYGIEFTRRKTYAKTSTEDWKYDNDNFIISVVRAGSMFASKKDEGYDASYFKNILDPPTAYNLDISPKRSFKNWGYFLNGCLHHEQTKKVKFAFGEANYIAESKRTDEAEVIIENENTLVSDLETPLWVPEYYEFEAPINAAVIQAMKANPYGVIQFRKDSKSTYNRAFIINCKVDIENKKGNFKLLRANI
jgi:hypothetical protein